MKIRYSNKQTNAKCEYIEIHKEDMPKLIHRATMILTRYAELTADPNYIFVANERDQSQFGKRGKAAFAPFKANSRLSLLGGLIFNYYSKENSFKNDLSKTQIPYITNVINECAEAFDFDEIEFTINILS